MAKIYDSIMSLIKPARMATAATTLGETEHKVTAATDIIVPSLLGCMLKRGETKEVEEVFQEARRLKVYENYDKVWTGSGIIDHVNIGERMENRLLGSHDPKFNASVGTAAGIKKDHADRLTNWVAATIAAWFAGRMAAGASYKSLLGELANEKDELRKGVPAAVLSELGLGAVLGVAAAHKATAAKPVAAKSATPKSAAAKPASKKKCNLCWLWWLLGIIALALILFFCLRSCCKKDVKKDIDTNETVAAVVNETPALTFTTEKMVLPDGTHIAMYQGAIEDAIEAFLDSDKYKKATDAELSSVWFEFTDIDFKHNSATEFQDTNSRDRLAGLVNTLKKYPGVKVKVGAFADKTGTRAVNYAITKKRAETVKNTLVAAGFPATHVTIEGFGEQYADIPETASDARRAPDRDIAMRFTK